MLDIIFIVSVPIALLVALMFFTQGSRRPPTGDKYDHHEWDRQGPSI